MDLLSGTVGAIVGGLGASLLSHVLSKPRLKLSIGEVGIDPLQPEDNKGIEKEILSKGASDFLITSKEFRDITHNNPYVSMVDKTYQHPLLFTMDLYRIARDNAKAELLNGRMSNAIKMLKQYLNSSMHSEFMETWVEHEETIYSHLNGEVRRGNFTLNAPEDGGQEKYYMGQDVDGDYIVRVGARNISLVFSTTKTHQDAVEALCKNLAKALSVFDKKCLGEVVTFLDTINFEDPIFKQTTEATKDMLIKHSKIYIRCTITNYGRSGASILGAGKLRIYANGYSLNKGTGPKIDSNIEFNVHAVENDNISTKRALTISGGGCISVLFVSDNILLNMNKDQLIDLYGSERQCEIFLMEDQNKQLSSKVKFSPNK